MRRYAFIIFLWLGFGSATAQEKNGKLVCFSNITEASVGFQLGKTTRVTSALGDETKAEVAGFKFPMPRISSSFGALIGNILFLGPGIAYTYQPADDNGSSVYPNIDQHHISAYGHLRIHFAKGLIRPYTELKGGYTHIFPGQESTPYDASAFTWDGAFAEPAIGLGVKLGGHGQLNVSLGYQFMNVYNRSQGLTSVDDFGPELRDSYHRLLLSLGFSFF